jgi:arylsulfatase A-like enzyme
LTSVQRRAGIEVRARERLGIADNTAIRLTSDNGGVTFQGRSLHRIADNGILYERSIREPLILYWLGVAEPGHTSNVPVTGTDMMPTLRSIAKAAAPSPSAEEYNFASNFADKASDLVVKLRARRGNLNAAMPRPDPARAQLRLGPAGCIWNPTTG